jgi:presequence protease
VLTSYRDPNLAQTLATYDRAADMLREASLDAADLARNVIGAIGGIDSYQTPDAKGWSSMVDWLIGDTDEYNQRWRDEVLGAGLGDFRKVGDALSEIAREGTVVVMGSEQALAEEAGRREGFKVTRIM